MDKPQNKYFAVSYKLYSTNDGEAVLEEETQEGKPFQFISGFGIALPSFEEAIVKFGEGEEFDFSIDASQAYGERDEEAVLDLDRDMFTINGHFDHENIFRDAIVPLQDAEGQRFFGKVVEISDDKVKMDLNHPLAGKNLNFKGKVEECREATNEEIQAVINMMSGEGCGCGHDHCECDHDHCECGGHHHDGDGEHHCHHHHDGDGEHHCCHHHHDDENQEA